MTKSELKSIINECIEEINQDMFINENYDKLYITESDMEKAGIHWKDIKDPDKLIDILRSKPSPWDVIKIILLIMAHHPFISAGILTILMAQISNVKDKLSAAKLQRTINCLKRQLAKLKKQLAEEKDPEKRKELQKAIKELEKKIAELEKEKRKADVEKRLSLELERAKAVKKMITDDDWQSYADEAINKDCFALAIAIGNLSTSAVHKKFHITEGLDSIVDYDDEYYKDLIASFVRHFRLKDPREKSMFIMFAIDDTLYVYGHNTTSFYFGDWDTNEGYFYTVDQLRALGQKLRKDPDYIEAFAEIGMTI